MVFWLAVAAAAVPLAVHFLTRPRPVRMPFSTVRFIREAVKQRRARNRLRDAIILALRTLAILLLGWAIARPLLGEKKLVSTAEEGATARVVLLDVSQSMAAVDGGVDAFQRARAAAGQYLEYRPGLRVNLIAAGAAPRAVFEAPSTNVESLREQLAESQVRPERLNLLAALSAAGDMLAKIPGTNVRRELVIISDFQRSNWATANFALLPDDTLIQLESVAAEEPPDNLAVTGVQVQGRPAEGREVLLEVEVGNYAAGARRAKVEVTLGDTAYQLEELCPPRTKTTISKAVTVPQAGWQMGTARIARADDALEADNERPFVLDVRPAPTYALITREPVSKRPSSTYYIERALLPYGETAGGARVERMSPARMDMEILSNAELLVIDHPGRLKSTQIEMLVSLLRRGRAVFYVASELVDATNLKLLAEAAGGGLQPPVDLVPPPRGSLRRNLFLADVKTDRAPFQGLGDKSGALLAPLRFSGGLATQRIEGALDDDIVATYSDRSTCLYVTSSEAGSLAVLNADLAASTLHSSSAFAILIEELIEHLLQQNRGEGAAAGELLVRRLPPTARAAASLKVVDAAGQGVSFGDLVEEGDGIVWRWPDAGPPGVYQVRRDAEAITAVAVTTPPEESDLRTLDADVLTGRLAGERTVQYNSTVGDDQQRDDTWIWFAVACVLCMLGEIVALRVFNS